jgi:hypothetical protein
MLDMTVYNNVFVSEELGMGKKGAGVKVDRATVSPAAVAVLLHCRLSSDFTCIRRYD